MTDPGMPYPASIPPVRPPQRKGIRLRPGFIVIIVFVLVVAGAAVGIVVLFASGKAVAAEVSTEPVSTAGANPFMPPVGTDQPGVTAPASTGGSFNPASTPGLYGGTLNNASCDPAAMVAFLQANPVKGAAWAGVLGIQPAGIPSYVAELTPVILRSDTYVTNHGFVDDHATTLTSVLQAGTAVLVDKYGMPRVRCYCGNPLTPAVVPSSPRYVGPVWPGFSSTTVTVIQETTTVINTFTLVNPLTNQVFERPRGSAGATDVPVSGLPASSSTPAAAAPPVTQQPQARTSSGSHVLTQQDAADCSFSDAPKITGTISVTAQPDGRVTGTLRGKGSGTRQLSCNGTTGTMNWNQDYSVSMSGQVSGGKLTASGTLNNTNRTTLTGCAQNGQPSACPAYQQGVGQFPVTFAGSYNPATGAGSGTFVVQDVARPTTGTWTLR